MIRRCIFHENKKEQENTTTMKTSAFRMHTTTTGVEFSGLPRREKMELNSFLAKGGDELKNTLYDWAETEKQINSLQFDLDRQFNVLRMKMQNENKDFENLTLQEKIELLLGEDDFLLLDLYSDLKRSNMRYAYMTEKLEQQYGRGVYAILENLRDNDYELLEEIKRKQTQDKRRNSTMVDRLIDAAQKRRSSVRR